MNLRQVFLVNVELQGFAFDNEMDLFMRKAAVILSDFHLKKNVSW